MSSDDDAASNDNGAKTGGKTETSFRGSGRDHLPPYGDPWPGSANVVALGLLSLDAAHSLSLAMQNAVVEQQNGWLMQRALMTKAVDQLLRNNAGDRAVDLLLRVFNPADTAPAGT